MEERNNIQEALITEEVIGKDEIYKQQLIHKRNKIWLNDFVKKCEHKKFKTISKKDKIIQCRSCKIKLDLINEVILYENEDLNIEKITLDKKGRLNGEESEFTVVDDTANFNNEKSIDKEVIKSNSDEQKIKYLLNLFRRHIF